MPDSRPAPRRSHEASKRIAVPTARASSVLDVATAMEEIMRVPSSAIHRDSALAWGARAAASYQVCATASTLDDAFHFLYLGEHYREAALAHAALGEEWELLYAEIDDTMAQDRAMALEATDSCWADAGETCTRRTALEQDAFANIVMANGR